MSAPTQPKVRAGQVWTDCERGRVRVIAVADGYATLKPAELFSAQGLRRDRGSLLLFVRGTGLPSLIPGLGHLSDELSATFAYPQKGAALVKNVLVDRLVFLLGPEAALLVYDSLQVDQHADGDIRKFGNIRQFRKIGPAPNLIGERMYGCNFSVRRVVGFRERNSDSLPQLSCEPDQVELSQGILPPKLKSFGPRGGDLLFQLAILAPEVALSRVHAVHRGSTPVPPITAFLKANRVDECSHREQCLRPSSRAAPPLDRPAGPDGQKAIGGHLQSGPILIDWRDHEAAPSHWQRPGCRRPSRRGSAARATPRRLPHERPSRYRSVRGDGGRHAGFRQRAGATTSRLHIAFYWVQGEHVSIRQQAAPAQHRRGGGTAAAEACARPGRSGELGIVEPEDRMSALQLICRVDAGLTSAVARLLDGEAGSIVNMPRRAVSACSEMVGPRSGDGGAQGVGNA